MNFIFISPNFPHTYWNFCDRLRRNGVNVLGIGDCPYFELEEPLRNALVEYYKVDSLENYGAVHEAVRFFSEKYGKIDWLESNNEYWLEKDAQLRTEFDINTGVKADEIENWKRKSLMHKTYVEAGIPKAKQHFVTTLEESKNFIKEVGYPVIAKPDIGVGAAHTYKIENQTELEDFHNSKPNVDYVMEEFIEGNVCSYDAIVNSKSEVLFESMSVFPPSIADIVNKELDLAYYVEPKISEKLQKMGRKTVKAFQVKSRFVHLEFFCLTKPNKHIGEIGDFSALEVNMRPAGGYTPDMVDFAHSTDVYQIWADMVTTDALQLKDSGKHEYCVYASRKDKPRYIHSHEEIINKYGNQMKMCERMPEVLSAAMGSQMYTVCLPNKKEAEEFIKFVHQREN
ncbi:ATP-grasp domain-containing protein [bacterium]|nr:ATP-grasp domain-containing protein [bacterium]